jgi:2-phospho-L-lactate guanylyltransferase
MAADVLSIVAQCHDVKRIVVCSSDPRAEEMARFHGAAFFEESRLECNGLAEVINRITAQLCADGATECAIVHCDLPLLTCHELERFLAAHNGSGSKVMTIAPDRRMLGTNLLALRPLKGFRTHYGKDSYRRHCDLAHRRGATLQVCDLPGAGLDIDEPDDLRELALDPRLDLAVETRRFLGESGLLERISSLIPKADRLYCRQAHAVLD